MAGTGAVVLQSLGAFGLPHEKGRLQAALAWSAVSPSGS